MSYVPSSTIAIGIGDQSQVGKHRFLCRSMIKSENNISSNSRWPAGVTSSTGSSAGPLRRSSRTGGINVASSVWAESRDSHWNHND